STGTGRAGEARWWGSTPRGPSGMDRRQHHTAAGLSSPLDLCWVARLRERRQVTARSVCEPEERGLNLGLHLNERESARHEVVACHRGSFLTFLLGNDSHAAACSFSLVAAR